MASKMFVHLAAAIVLTLTTLGNVRGAEPSPKAFPTQRQVRQAVERSLPFLEKEGTAWMKERKCIACHHVPYLLWTHNEAGARRFAIDRKNLQRWTDWSLTFYPADLPWFKLSERDLRALKESVPAAVLARLQPLVGRSFADREEFLADLRKLLSAEELPLYQAEVVNQASQFTSGGGPFHITQLLLAGQRSSTMGPQTESWAALAQFLLKHQEADGSWKTVRTQFMHQKRPEKEMHQAMTMWTLLALNSSSKPDAALAKANERALSWLKDVRPGQSMESLVLLMLIHHNNGRRDQAKELLDKLLERQNDDGGWSWLQHERSDALATGQTLYALGFIKLPSEHAAIRRAWRFLLEAQREEGSWVVPAGQFSAKTDAAYVQSADSVYRYWGTAWATIGLLQTLP